MIMGDEQFKDLKKRIAERKASWTDFDRLSQFASKLIEQHDEQSKALAALLEGRSDTVIGGFYIYKAEGGGAAVMSRKLNYEANTNKWQAGDIVIHDGDAKEPKMLMKVLGYSRDGQIRTQYVSKSRKQRVMKNFFDCLHQPERFDLQSAWGDYAQEHLDRTQADWDRVRIFNFHHAVGTLVHTTSADGGFDAKTTGPAYIDKGGNAFVSLEGHGAWSLRFVKVVNPIEAKAQEG
jgi:hypothetical protein